MYICLLPENQHLCKQTAVIAKPLGCISIHIPSLIRIERDLVGEPGPRKLLLSLNNDLYLSAAPKQLLCQQAAIIAMQPDHITIHRPSLIRIERGLGWKPGQIPSLIMIERG